MHQFTLSYIGDRPDSRAASLLGRIARRKAKGCLHQRSNRARRLPSEQRPMIGALEVDPAARSIRERGARGARQPRRVLNGADVEDLAAIDQPLGAHMRMQEARAALKVV